MFRVIQQLKQNYPVKSGFSRAHMYSIEYEEITKATLTL
jgi:hypothetical protein